MTEPRWLDVLAAVLDLDAGRLLRLDPALVIGFLLPPRQFVAGLTAGAVK
jgi:hypothetical protein